MTKPAAVVAVATSGGRDSMALLHCTAAQAAAQGVQVVALHVHHGLMPEADEWAHHVRDTCKRWARRGWPLQFAMQRLEGKPARGQSVEAWARDGRYAALLQMAQQASAQMVLLAHHQDDQAETFLLQALRGAGPAGLAAMPALMQRDGIAWARPWLSMSGDAISAYAKRHRLAFVRDPSNADPRFARSRLRVQTITALRDAFPDAAAALSAASAACAQAQTVLDEVCAADLVACSEGSTLRAPACKALSAARAGAVVLAWLRLRGGPAQRASVQAVLGLLNHGSSGSVIDVAGGQVRLYRSRLTYVASQGNAGPLPSFLDLLGGPDATRQVWGRSQGNAGPLPSFLDPLGGPDATRQVWGRSEARANRRMEAIQLQSAQIQGIGSYEAPGGRLVVRRATATELGLRAEQLAQAQWSPRQGGEQFQRGANTTARSLKKAYQEAGVPAWQRATPILVDQHGDILFVPGLGVDARTASSKGRGRLALEWRD